MKNDDRVRPSTRGSRKRSLCSGLAIRPSRYMFPSSGAAVLTASGPSSERPDFFKTAAVSRCVRWLPSDADVRRQDTGSARLAAHFLHQFVARSMAGAPRIPLVGNHDLAHESLDSRGDLRRALRAYAYAYAYAHARSRACACAAHAPSGSV